MDTVEEKPILAIRPLFDVATTRVGSDVVLINEPPPTSNEPEAAHPCFWCRQARESIYTRNTRSYC